MQDASVRLLNEVSQWQQPVEIAWQRPVAIALWAVLMFSCLGICVYAINQGNKIKNKPSGIIDPITLLEKSGKIDNNYPLILTFSLGGLSSLTLAAVFALTIKDTPWCGQFSFIVGNQYVQALVTALVTAFYSVLIGWIFTKSSGGKSLSELSRGKSTAAFIVGFLIGIQIAHSLSVLYFSPCSGGLKP